MVKEYKVYLDSNKVLTLGASDAIEAILTVNSVLGYDGSSEKIIKVVEQCS